MSHLSVIDTHKKHTQGHANLTVSLKCMFLECVCVKGGQVVYVGEG